MRWGKPIKNKKRRDPRYFLNESAESMDEGALDVIKGAGKAAKSAATATAKTTAATDAVIAKARASSASGSKLGAVTRTMGAIGAGVVAGTALSYLLFWMTLGYTTEDTNNFIKIAWTNYTKGEEAAYNVWAEQQRKKGLDPSPYNLWKTSDLNRQVQELRGEDEQAYRKNK